MQNTANINWSYGPRIFYLVVPLCIDLEPQVKTFEISHEIIDEKELTKYLSYFGLRANSLEPEMQSHHDYAGSAPSAQLGQETTSLASSRP